MSCFQVLVTCFPNSPPPLPPHMWIGDQKPAAKGKRPIKNPATMLLSSPHLLSSLASVIHVFPTRSRLAPAVPFARLTTLLTVMTVARWSGLPGLQGGPENPGLRVDWASFFRGGSEAPRRFSRRATPRTARHGPRTSPAGGLSLGALEGTVTLALHWVLQTSRFFIAGASDDGGQSGAKARQNTNRSRMRGQSNSAPSLAGSACFSSW